MLNKRCFIIAEAGVNHNGDMEIAKKLIDLASQAGADAVKFQTFKTENLVTSDAPKAEYQKETTGFGNQFDMLKKLELSYEQHLILKNYCDDKKIMFMSTPFDFESVDLLESLNVDIYKISSGDLTNLPLLDYISRLNKPIILSTGMANLGEIEAAMNTIRKNKNIKITLLHCTSNYPTAYEDVNLNAMITLKNSFQAPVGYSDHTVGIEIPIAAFALGAEVIEKHFTLDNNMEGPDHRASLSPIELMSMVKSIRNLEISLGDGIKGCNKNELGTRYTSRKSIVAKSNLKKDQIISLEDLNFKRPESGLSPIYVEGIIGKRLTRDVSKDEAITFSSVE